MMTYGIRDHSHHYLNKWFTVNWARGNTLQWNFNDKYIKKISTKSIWKIVCKMRVILFRPQCDIILSGTKTKALYRPSQNLRLTEVKSCYINHLPREWLVSLHMVKEVWNDGWNNTLCLRSIMYYSSHHFILLPPYVGSYNIYLDKTCNNFTLKLLTYSARQIWTTDFYHNDTCAPWT